MKKVIVAILLGIFISLNVSQADDTKYKNEVLAKVGSENITFGMLERSYKKNLEHKNTVFSGISIDSLESFLDLFIRYRLKVQFAYKYQYDTIKDVEDDFITNRRLLAESYYYNEHLYKPFVDSKYARRNVEKKIAIIMQSYSELADGSDSLVIIDSMNTVLDRLIAGENFGDMARMHSVDKATRVNDGVIDRWLTSGTFADGLENAMYKTKVGEVYPELVNDRKAFFILKVVDEAPRRYVLASHILIRESPEQNADSIADVVIEKLNKGAKFTDLVAEYSQDAGSKKTNGSLDEWYSRSTGFENHKFMLPDFEDALFSLEEGETSGKIKTEFGYHIIRCDSSKSYKEGNDEKALNDMYRKLYFYEAKINYLDSLTKVHGYKLHKDIMKSLTLLVDTTKTNLEEDWDYKIPDAFSKDTLFEINNKAYSVVEFTELFNSTPKFRGFATSRKGFTRAITEIIHPIAFDLETEGYENKNKEFSEMIEEFKDGILLFKVEADQVWDKLTFDTTEAKKFYEARKGQYTTDYSYDLSEILIFRDSLANDLYKQITKDGASFDTLAKYNTQRSGKRNTNGHLGIVSAETDERAIQALMLKPKKGDVIGPVKLKTGMAILRVNEIYPIRQKTFEEAIPDFSAGFQEIQQKKLSDQWVENIKNEIPVKLEDKTIKKIFKKK